jgi:hypothetical protein
LKNIALILIILIETINCSAQSNLDFEKWNVNYNGIDEAKSWTNTSDATKFNAPSTLFKVVENPFSGLASLKLTTAFWDDGAPYGLDTLVGSLLQQNAYTKRPLSFKFSYKCTPQLGDELLVGVQLTRTLNGELIVIGEGYFTSSKIENKWVSKVVTIDYYTTDTPEKIHIMALSSANAVITNGIHGFAKIGSTLFLDDIKLRVTKEETLTTQSYVHVYPNPAKEYINVETNFSLAQKIEIYNLSGKLLIAASIGQYSKIDISKLPSGTYIYKVFSEQSDRITATNKFNVVR